MCGIAGIFSRSPSINESSLNAMGASLAHRGPDDQGIWLAPHMGLAQTRLSIIDLAGGHQPLIHGDLALAANGEVYNHPELREWLEGQGRRFATHSDSETILHAYAQDPDGYLHRLRGMYAFALFDQQQQTLTLARDRLGIKPLYYAVDNDRLLFGSEIKAILAELPRVPEINPAALYQFLENQFSTGRDTIFAGIHRVLPGEVIAVDKDLHLSHQRYWDAGQIEARETDFDTAQASFNELFEEVMVEHMRSDVPFGLFLSGGTDSAILASVLSRLHDQPLRSYSVGFANVQMKDELNEAQRIADLVGTEHQVLKLNGEQVLGRLPQTIWAADDLMRDNANLPTSLLAETAAKDLKVVFSGEGGDEVFGGYRRYRSGIEPMLKNFMRPGSGGFRTRGQWGGAWSNKLFGDALREHESAMRAPFIEAWQRTPKGWSDVQRRQYLDLTTALPDNLLVKADRMLMSFSLEGRVPFLDHRVVEFGFGLPDELKLQGKNGKVFLKRWAEQFLPKDHLWQSKRGFHVPVSEWMQGPLLQQVGQRLLKNDAVAQWFHRPALEALIAAQESKGKVSRELFSLVQFAIWHRLFVEKGGAITPGNNESVLEWI